MDNRINLDTSTVRPKAERTQSLKPLWAILIGVGITVLGLVAARFLIFGLILLILATGGGHFG